MQRYNILFIFTLVLLLTSCSFSKRHGDGPPSNTHINLNKIHNAVPKIEPLSRIGNPSSYVVFGKRYRVMKSSTHYVKTGIASWYGTKFDKRRTSNGEVYDMLGMTAAHKTLPLPTYAKVTNLKNGQEIIVRINDRGPFHANRIIDLSYVAARKLGMTGKGTALVRVEAIDPKYYHAATQAPKVQAKSNHPTLYIQADAFASLSNAQNTTRQLKKILHAPARIHRKHQNNKTLYLVRLGPVSTVAEADKLSQKLASHGFPHAFVTVA